MTDETVQLLRLTYGIPSSIAIRALQAGELFSSSPDS